MTLTPEQFDAWTAAHRDPVIREVRLRTVEAARAWRALVRWLMGDRTDA